MGFLQNVILEHFNTMFFFCSIVTLCNHYFSHHNTRDSSPGGARDSDRADRLHSKRYPVWTYGNPDNECDPRNPLPVGTYQWTFCHHQTKNCHQTGHWTRNGVYCGIWIWIIIIHYLESCNTSAGKPTILCPFKKFAILRPKSLLTYKSVLHFDKWTVYEAFNCKASVQVTD